MGRPGKGLTFRRTAWFVPGEGMGGCLIKDHGFPRLIGIETNRLGTTTTTTFNQRFLLSRKGNEFLHIVRRRRRPIGQQVGHGKFHLHLQLIGLVGGGKTIALTGITIVIGIVPRHLVPTALQGLRIKLGHGGGRRSWFLSIGIGTALQNGNLDAFVIFNGTLEELVQLGRPIAGHATGNTGIVAQTLGRTGQTLATIGIVGQTSLGL